MVCVQEDNSGLLASNIDLESRARRLVSENEDLERRLRQAQLIQHELTDELGELRGRVAELSTSLSDAQDEVRALRRRRSTQTRPAGSGIGPSLSRYSMNSSFNEHSLAAEISDSLKQRSGETQAPFEIGISAPQSSAALSTTLNVLNTVRSANAQRGCATGSTSGHESMDEQAAAAANAHLPPDDTQYE